MKLPCVLCVAFWAVSVYAFAQVNQGLKANGGIGQKTLDELQRDGVDADSRAGAPLFVDPENGDFRFKLGSPALEMGILPIDVSKIGLRA